MTELVGDDAEPLETAWDEALIRRAWQESAGMLRRFMYELAKRPGAWVPIHELYAAMDVGPRVLPGMLGTFTVRARNRYKRSTWPFRWEYPNWVHGYEMSAEAAEIIVSLERDGSSGVS